MKRSDLQLVEEKPKTGDSKQLRWPWRRKKKEEQDWRMMQLPNGSGWPWRRTKKEKQDCSYRTAHVIALIKGVVDVGVVLTLKPILISWQICLSFK